MSAEAWVALAGLIVTLLGALAAAAYWAHAVYTTQTQIVSEVKNLNVNMIAFEARNEKDHDQIWRRVDEHSQTIGNHGERLSKFEGKVSG